MLSTCSRAEKNVMSMRLGVTHFRPRAEVQPLYPNEIPRLSIILNYPGHDASLEALTIAQVPADTLRRYSSQKLICSSIRHLKCSPLPEDFKTILGAGLILVGSSLLAIYSLPLVPVRYVRRQLTTESGNIEQSVIDVR